VTVQLAASGDVQPPSQTYPVPSFYSDNLRRRNSLDRSRRRAEIPLTYEDLQVPIDQPDPIKERFNATVPIRALELEQERTAELVMPAMESLATSQVEQIEKAVIGSLASARESLAKTRESSGKMRNQTLDRLPNAQSSDRTRHWIRQPD